MQLGHVQPLKLHWSTPQTCVALPCSSTLTLFNACTGRASEGQRSLYDKQGNRRYQTPSRFGATHRWASLSIRRGVKSALPRVELLWVYAFSRRLLLAIMCKHNVIHKTRSTQQIPTPTLSNMRQTFGEDVTLGFRDMLADSPAAKRHAPAGFGHFRWLYGHANQSDRLMALGFLLVFCRNHSPKMNELGVWHRQTDIRFVALLNTPVWMRPTQ